MDDVGIREIDVGQPLEQMAQICEGVQSVLLVRFYDSVDHVRHPALPKAA